MTDQTTENFLKVMAQFQWPEPVVPSYRLYYYANGMPKCYSMEILDDKYVEIDAEAFALRASNVRVVDGRIITVATPNTVKKLVPGSETGTACDPTDVCVVVGTDKPHVLWNIKTNEIN